MTRVNINVPYIHDSRLELIFSNDCVEAGLANSVHGIEGKCNNTIL